MLRNSHQITTTSSSSIANQWPPLQNNHQSHTLIDDHKPPPLMASSSSSSSLTATTTTTTTTTNTTTKLTIAEKTNQDLQPLRCPRCDSANTKFCYYNNYSLSQPRHFCKACKRYWTRGGTLRNVPVGGGCRKNKRVKRQPAPNPGADGISISSSIPTTNPSIQSLTADLSPAASSHLTNPLFYNPLELNFPFSTHLGSTRVSSTGFDLPHQMNGLGLGFSSGFLSAELPNGDHKNNGYYSSPGSNNNSIFFGSSSNFGGSTSTMASLLASGLQHHKNSDHLMSPYGSDHTNEMGKELRSAAEGQQNRQQSALPLMNPNPTAQINSSDTSSSSPLVWNTAGAWFDPSNIGSSSVPSLI